MDFRSDMLGRRPEEIMRSMMQAASDPPSMADDEDRHLQRLQDMLRELSGLEAALLLPTCTMANQIAIRLHCPRGRAILADRDSHLVIREAASAIQLNGAVLQTLAGERGHLPPEAVRSALQPQVGLVWLENTHNAAGGTVMPNDWLSAIALHCRAAGVALHLDGSRLWNAAVASARSLEQLVQGCDSVAISLNKCLDAPLGALLLGRADVIAEARGVRQLLGGFWRPIGPIAAAALRALQDRDERIARVHALARRFHHLVRERAPALSVAPPETNIVMLSLAEEEDVEPFLRSLERRGVRALGYGGTRVRFVLHSRLTDEAIDTAASAVATAAAGRSDTASGDGGNH